MRADQFLLLASVTSLLTGCQSLDKSSTALEPSVAKPAPSTAVAATDKPNGGHSEPSERCQAWTIANDHVAVASIETFCARFGPSPNSIAEAGAKEPFGTPPLVASTERGLWLSYGTLDGQEYAFDRQGKFVGASVWREVPFGDCSRRVSRYRGRRVVDIDGGQEVQKC
jgi:hypothetical protein